MEKWVVITGANSGIGLATAEALIGTGQYQLILTARPGRGIPINAAHFQRVDLDLADEHSIEHAAQIINEISGGKLFALFNNAGYGLQMAMEDVPVRSLRLQLETNLIGPVLLTQRLLPALMASADSRLLFNSSALGYATMPFRGPYCASKFALEAVADALRMELAHTCVKVIVLEPGPIKARFRENAHQILLNHQQQMDNSRLIYSGLLTRLAAAYGSKVLDASVVAESVVKILANPLPKPRYRFTGSAKLAYYLRLLPTRIRDWVFAKTEPVRVKIE